MVSSSQPQSCGGRRPRRQKTRPLEQVYSSTTFRLPSGGIWILLSLLLLWKKKSESSITDHMVLKQIGLVTLKLPFYP
ncbi:hypothetical protein L6452_42460 [Arctium lappa]|uniref:Uncharacterized protein n=1 Tax=Arctium lappa TaxID=4217 RepID=A0ACB8XIB4_ARCLA|nr:hypothetical protein L6452_42460 [Arctium lappa]